MQDYEAQQVRLAVSHWRKQNKNARILDDAAFAALLHKVRDIGIMAADDELAVYAASCWCKPTGSVNHADAACLLGVLRQHVPGGQAAPRANDFAVAFGSGAWPKAGPRPSEVWPEAHAAVVMAAERAVLNANQWLSDRVVGYPARSKTVLWMDAARLAIRLENPESPAGFRPGEQITIDSTPDDAVVWAPPYHEPKYVPPGAKFAWTVQTADAQLSVYKKPPDPLERPDPEAVVEEVKTPDEVFEVGAGATMVVAALDVSVEVRWSGGPKAVKLDEGDSVTLSALSALSLVFRECTCGTCKCEQRHRLAEWDPLIRLTSYIASAVKGPNSPIRTNSFQGGMYYGLMSEEDFDA